ncbi:OmpA family protein [Apibacter adventoris]|uniref:OmpA-like domain-containing protein n=1 Tax=Apibacter adventoris TaxID=1679466 RepID=A0A2S8ACA4_9FLAO|nr:OmpA family protein [Apibacter adventoris]PQL92356.1 hypothetical protein C4S77_06705 [Apibacter adventoris]
MAKGVKKIKYAGGKVYGKKCIPNKLLVVPPDEWIIFQVGEWFSGTTEEDKKKDLVWMRLTQDRKQIIAQIPSKTGYKYKFEKYNCGLTTFYIEASLSGKSDDKNEVGLYLRGWCEPKIINSAWSTSYKGNDIRKTHHFSYGDIIYLNLQTEGLNGYKNLIIDIYRRVSGIISSKDDQLIHVYTNVSVVNGEINLTLKNTSAWWGKITSKSSVEEFYVKVKNPETGEYITDGKDTAHARFLRIKKQQVTPQTLPPANTTPTTVQKPDPNVARIEPCKFTQIAITEPKQPNEEKAPEPIPIYKDGQKLQKVTNPKESIERKILFEFDSDQISTEGKKTLDNILKFLFEHKFSHVDLKGYACVIGKMDYNRTLSQKRADAVKKYFRENKLDVSRVRAIGYGEVNPTDDKKGRDNIRYKDEKQYKEARCVYINFEFYGHDAQTLIYETIAPSKNKNLTISVSEYETIQCFRETNKHTKTIRIVSPDAPEISKNADTVTFPVHSDLSSINIAPLQYIWPKWNLTPGKKLDSASPYFIHIHSCRYYSNQKNATVLVKAYPDVKWSFHFFLNLSNNLSVKWQNLSPAKHKEMQKLAGKIGAEARWKQTEIDWGVILEANWDKYGEEYKSNKEFTAKFENKIKAFYKVFASLKEFSKGVTGEVKGTVSKTRLGKKVPFKIYFDPPNLCLGAEWQLARGQKNKVLTQKIGTEMEFYFKAEPLISLGLNIDLLAGLVQVGVGVATAGTGNAAALQIFNGIRDWLEDDDHAVTLKMYIDLEITGTINGNSKINFNTESDASNGEAKLETVLKAELKAGIEVRGSVVVLIGEAYIEAEASIKGIASVTFGHGLYFENKSSEEKTIYYQPKLNFDGLRVKGVLKAKVGLYIKKGWFKGDRSANLADHKIDKNILSPFNVIEKLEELTGISSKITFK